MAEATDQDTALDAARQATGQDDPPGEAVAKAKRQLLEDAARPLAANPQLRQLLSDTRRSYEQTLDIVSPDHLIEAGFSDDQAGAPCSVLRGVHSREPGRDHRPPATL